MFSKKFFYASNDICTYKKHVNAPYMRREFEVSDEIEAAEITVTSTGFYKLFINGTDITKDFLSPYITNPDQCLIYDKYDVGKYLKKGINCIGFVLGNGMVNCIGGYIWGFDKVPYRSAPSIAFDMQIKYKSGEEKGFEADGLLKCAPSPITFDDLRSGTHIDSRLKQDGWNMPGFDDGSWTNAVRAETPRGKESLYFGNPVISSRILKPVKITENAESAPIKNMDKMCKESIELSEKSGLNFGDTYSGRLFDFGENVSGVLRIKVTGKPGQKLDFQFAEYLDEENRISFENIASFYPQDYCQHNVYICCGDGEEECTFPFTYHCGRWCLVSGLEENQEIELEYLVIHADLPHRGGFECSDMSVNKLQQNAVRSALSNLTCFPTDCPHREKNGWTGDAAMSCEYFTLNFGMETLFRQWLVLAREAQRTDGAMPGIVPTHGWGFDWGNGPTWDSFIVELPYRTYIYRGDKAILSENADMIFRYLNYISKKRMKNGLIDIGLGDWCQTGRNEWNPDCPTIVTDSIMCVYICERAEYIFDVLGQEAQRAFAAALRAEFRNAVRKYLVDFSTMLVESSSQCGQAMALYCNIFENGERREAYNRLVEIIHANDDHFNCGMIGVRMIFHVLAEFGDAELAYKMIMRTDYPSYGMWAMQDLTSLPETFTPKTDIAAGSLNHHFMGDISNFFITRIAGIRVNPYKDDPCCVYINPNFVSKLDFAKADYDTVGGKVKIMWKRISDGKIAVAVEKAENVDGVLKLPFGYAFADIEDINIDFSSDGFSAAVSNQRKIKGKNTVKLENRVYVAEIMLMHNERI